MSQSSRNNSLSETSTLDEQNAAFWNELCGTGLANHLGIKDGSIESLARFDEWYFSFYPYLTHYIPFERLRGKRVLEVGLGYGSVAQRLAQSTEAYFGLDIAPGPVRMVNSRLKMNRLPGKAIQDSVLSCPFDNESFDFVVAIGCYHHTGNTQLALDETWRVLRAGGIAIVMVYNAYSYRRWIHWPLETVRYASWDYLGVGGAETAAEQERAAYDANADGVAAPATQFYSRHRLKRMTKKFKSVRYRLENANAGPLSRFISRSSLLPTLGKFAGLDIYMTLQK